MLHSTGEGGKILDVRTVCAGLFCACTQTLQSISRAKSSRILGHPPYRSDRRTGQPKMREFFVMGDVKQCTKCKTIKPVSEFYRRSDTDGYKSHCKDCEREYRQRRMAENPDHVRRLARERSRRYEENSPEKARARAKRYYDKNQDKCIKMARRYRRNNPGANAKSARRWKRNNHEKVVASKQARRAREQQAPGEFSATEWVLLKQYYNNSCLCCDRSEPDVQITPDHVIPLSRGGANDISNIQPLCHSCNSSKSDRHTTDYRPNGSAVPPLLYQRVMEALQ